MSCLHQENLGCQICHMNFSLKPKTHINTIHNLQVITAHGARKKPTLLQKLASAPPSSSWKTANSYAQENICVCPCHHICPITHPCATPAPHITMLILLKCSLDVLLATGTAFLPSPILTLPCPCQVLSAAKHAYTCAVPYRYASDPATPSPPSPILVLPHHH
ncbi:hypothetical protein O181_036406 [Austropuccinia psidii MF-1]|uniref:Uncharacterized protein n=1 Tax=Austropuccinia psidii MF-1 TaxID=1389203 RepID=A0A9Q3H9W5_9BASI|nr:hypothetical protein [Austropuccinia psidii MF-1]